MRDDPFPTMPYRGPAAWRLRCLEIAAAERRKTRRALLRRLAGEQNWRCAYCARRFDEAGPGSRATLDHLQAKAHGGIDSWENCVAACADCNVRRGTANPRKFARRVATMDGARA